MDTSPPPATAQAAALANLFDSPTPPRPPPRAARLPNSALFFNSPTSSTGGSPSVVRMSERAPAASGSGGDAAANANPLDLFDGLDFDEPVGDEPVAVTAQADGEGLEPVAVPLGKRAVPKIDEARLLGPQGITKLVKTAQKMKFKGKGKEVEDLNNLINHYHVWAHQMFPKSKFKDTIAVVERVCIKRAMASALPRFKLEFDPPAPASPSLSPEKRTGSSPLPEVSFASSRANQTQQSRRSRSRSRSTSPSRPRKIFAASDSISRTPRAKGFANNDYDEEDDRERGWDMDEMIRLAEQDALAAEREMNAASGPSSAPAPATGGGGGGGEEEEEDGMDWAALDELEAQEPAPTVSKEKAPEKLKEVARPQAEPMEEPEEDWDAFDEMHG